MDYVWYLLRRYILNSKYKFREFITQIRAVMEVSKRPILSVTFFTPKILDSEKDLGNHISCSRHFNDAGAKT